MSRPAPQCGRNRGIDPRHLDERAHRRLLASYMAASDTDCWIWQGKHTGRRYGQFTVTRGGSTQREAAHRVMYKLHIGPIPDGLVLDHLCRTTMCVNPRHLEPVTNRENTLRGVGPSAAAAARRACASGHEYTDSNTLYDAAGARRCRACRNAWGRVNNRRARIAGPSSPIPTDRHGTLTGYRYWRCRCDSCCEASTEARRRYPKRRQRAAEVEAMP